MGYGQLRNVFGSTEGFEGLAGGHSVSLLHDGEECYPAMLEAIAGARSEILLEMYWFGSDRTGQRFANALIARAKAGVRVVVVYDAVGSFEADPAMWQRLRAEGVEVHEYNPIAPWRRRFRIGVVNRRNHRKMLIVDREVGFTGGVNIGDPWASLEDGGGGWRDDMIRIRGPSVAQMRRIFFHGIGSLTKGASPMKEEVSKEAGQAAVRVLANHYFGERRAIRAEYLRRIRAARRCVYVTNSYFVPDRRIRLALTRAAARGVEVRIIVPGKNDIFAVHHASRKKYAWFHARGVHLHEWGGEILHAKTAVVDGSWCTVGTYNLDYRSWRFNLEVAVSVEDPDVAGACEQQFLLDLERAPPVDWKAFHYRSLGDRFFENFFHLFRKLL